MYQESWGDPSNEPCQGRLRIESTEQDGGNHEGNDRTASGYTVRVNQVSPCTKLCFKCKKPGYIARNCCSRSELTCYNCGKRGNIFRVARGREMVYQTSSLLPASNWWMLMGETSHLVA